MVNLLAWLSKKEAPYSRYAGKMIRRDSGCRIAANQLFCLLTFLLSQYSFILLDSANVKSENI